MYPSIQHKGPVQARLRLFIADWLSRHNYHEGKYEETLEMNLNFNNVETYRDIPKCMIVEEIRHVTQDVFK